MAKKQTARGRKQDRARVAAGGRVPPLQDPCEPASRCDPASARYADLEIGGRVEMSVMPQGSLRSARAYDQADGAAGNHTVQVVHPSEER